MQSDYTIKRNLQKPSFMKVFDDFIWSISFITAIFYQVMVTGVYFNEDKLG